MLEAGLKYSKDNYDIERYEKLREISAEMIKEKSNISLEKVKNIFCNETGYQTPKIDTRAAIFKDNIYAYGICKIFVLCNAIEGDFKKTLELQK